MRICATRFSNGEIFYSLKDTKFIVESWRHHYNTLRPYVLLSYKPPASEVFSPPWPRGPPCNPTSATTRAGSATDIALSFHLDPSKGSGQSRYGWFTGDVHEER